ncbi:MAG: hypothetical protein DRJ49_06110 [Thermoprotei archaeon]|nr:MAG: hypothetical protein DRN53_05470 [Thermoprotei archaeon]RLE87685.1 MAG: hypothetical protein DRJ49_06110 [Thermoprotei archaeon]
MEDSTRLLGTLIRLRRRLALDIVDNMVFLIIIMIFLAVLPSVLVFILKAELNPILRSIVNCITLSLMMYSLIFSLSLSIWDLYNILVITPRIENISHIREEDEFFRKLFERRQSIIRRVVAFTSLIVSLLTISFTKDFKRLVYTYLLVEMFKHSPQLLIVPPTLLALFPLIYSILLLHSVNKRLSLYWERLSALIEGISTITRRCNICNETVSRNSIYCPFCGAYLLATKRERTIQIKPNFET